MTPEEYLDLVKKIYRLILAEIDKTNKSKNYNEGYYQLVVMFEFFRMLRGEAFLGIRPNVGEEQANLYKMQDEIGKKIEEIKSNVDFSDERTFIKLNILKDLYFIKK
jgi:hypothetical protein